ncbi:MAG: DUF58 domain-containing protein [Myxococcales bacterium]|nr:DUF58 domain-containing protein [Myxococcales bacterium]MCB9532330.1 DUF58 domain-containing protein [Myxococcales bacterium]
MTEPLFDDEFRKKIELLYLVSKKVFAGNSQATRRSKRLGAGIEVRDFRGYSAGDDLRHIDWNYYASTRELLVRLFEEEEDLHIYFLVDASPSMEVGDGAKLRYAKRVAAALAYIGLSNLDRVSVVPFADRVLGTLPASRGPSQIWKVFEFLERETTGPRTDFATALRDFVSRTRRRGLAVVLSDFYDPTGFEEGVNLLRYHRFEPLVFHVHDEQDARPNLRGDIELIDCESGDVVRVTATPALLARYAAAYDAQLERVEAFCRQKNLLYFRAPVHTAFDELVLRVFRAGGFLR